jgi:hypothetical protein
MSQILPTALLPKTKNNYWYYVHWLLMTQAAYCMLPLKYLVTLIYKQEDIPYWSQGYETENANQSQISSIWLVGMAIRCLRFETGFQSQFYNLQD